MGEGEVGRFCMPIRNGRQGHAGGEGGHSAGNGIFESEAILGGDV